jgi:sulfur-carrier protein
MEITYMSWLRTRMGTGKETVTLPADITSAQKLVDWLTQQTKAHEALFSYRSIISIAINGQLISDWETAVKDSDKISFFSPMAGG